MEYVKSDDDIATVCGWFVIEFLICGYIPSVTLSSNAMNKVKWAMAANICWPVRWAHANLIKCHLALQMKETAIIICRIGFNTWDPIILNKVEHTHRERARARRNLLCGCGRPIIHYPNRTEPNWKCILAVGNFTKIVRTSSVLGVWRQFRIGWKGFSYCKYAYNDQIHRKRKVFVSIGCLTRVFVVVVVPSKTHK